MATLAGCAAPPEAPEELSELARYLVREFDSEDPRALQAGLENLEAYLSEVDLEGDRSERSYQPADLTDSDVGGIEHPGLPLDGCVSVGVAGMSRWGIEWFGRYTQVTDQVPAEPSAARYERTFLEPEEPACFGEGDCPHMRTVNDVSRSNILYTIDFEQSKDFRWVDLAVDGETTGRRGMVSRGWMRESGFSADEQNSIQQSFTLDAFVGAPDGRTWRLQVGWSEVALAGGDVDGGIIAGVMAPGIDEHFVAQDDAMEEAFSL